MLTVAALLLAFCAAPAIAQTTALTKKQQKMIRKSVKRKVKELKASDWELYGSAYGIDAVLTRHYEALLSGDEEKEEIVGTAARCTNKTIGTQRATIDACNTYAQKAGGHVKGRVANDMFGDSQNPDAEFDRFYAAYENKVSAEIQGELKHSYTVIRQTGKQGGQPVYEVQAYFIVDPVAASRARIRAFEAAKAESQAAQKYAEQISEFVGEGVE